MEKEDLINYAHLLVNINLKEHLTATAMDNCYTNPSYTIIQAERVLGKGSVDWLKPYKNEHIIPTDQSFVMLHYYKRQKELNIVIL